MATRERWMEVGCSCSASLTCFNVEAFLRRLECLFLRRGIELQNDEVSDTTVDDKNYKSW
jgi:hypothetical protein